MFGAAPQDYPVLKASTHPLTFCWMKLHEVDGKCAKWNAVNMRRQRTGGWRNLMGWLQERC